MFTIAFFILFHFKTNYSLWRSFECHDKRRQDLLTRKVRRRQLRQQRGLRLDPRSTARFILMIACLPAQQQQQQQQHQI